MTILNWLAAIFFIAIPVMVILKEYQLAVLSIIPFIICVAIPIYQRNKRSAVRRRRYGQMHGSAKFAGKKDIKYFNYGSGAWGESLALGWMFGKRWSHNADPRYRVAKSHVLTMAPTGSGKGVGCVIPTLLEYRGNIVCLDIKGENWAVTHAWREKLGHKVIKIDPFGVCGGGTDGIDLITWLKTYPADTVSDALMIADSFVISGKGVDKEDHWDASAKTLLQALLVYATEVDLSLDNVRDIICKSGEAFVEAIRPLLSSPHKLVRRCAESYVEKEPKETSSILSTLIRHTAILDEDKISGVLNNAEGFPVGDLRRSSVDIYIVIPPERVSIYGRFIRLIVSLCLTAITRVKTRKQVLFLLDEVCQIGRLEPLETAISLTRGYEAFLWLIVQDLGQLKGVYGNKWSTFFANSVRQFFGTNDFETAKYLSDSMGNTTQFYWSTGTGTTGTGKQSESANESLIKRALMTPDEIMSMSPNNALIFAPGKRVALVHKLNYLRDKTYRGVAADNPLHQAQELKSA